MTTVAHDRAEDCTREQFQRLLEFNRHVAHDLRAPLVSVVGAVELAQAALAKGDTASAARLLQLLSNRANGMATLISELLLLSTARDAPLAFDVVDLTDIACSAVEDALLHMHLGQRPQVCIAALPRVLGSAVLLKQVYVNLVGNAVKFSSRTAAPCIEIGLCEQAGAKPSLFVRDNGVGFGGCHTQRLFDPFVRLHAADGYAGHGLGLNIVKRIVERHGGEVWATPHEQGGAAFHFTLGALG